METKTSLNNENPPAAKPLLAAGQVVDTYFGWAGHITLVAEELFKFGQGVHIIRLDDQHCFCIGPEDVIIPPIIE